MLSKLLVHIAKRHKDKMAACLRNMNVYVGQDIFLLTLQSDGPLSQKDLKGKLHLEFATIHKIAGRLQARGFVTKAKDPSDLRASIIELTDTGKEVCVQIQTCWDKLEKDFFEVLSEQEKALLNKLLVKLKN
jgi:DNA-binding MarR family transcriptional regulator